MFEKVSPNLDFLTREKEVLDFWKKNDIFQKSIDQREASKIAGKTLSIRIVPFDSYFKNGSSISPTCL